MNDGMAQSSAIFLFLRYSLGDKVDLSMVRVCHKSVTHPFLCVFLYILVES